MPSIVLKLECQASRGDLLSATPDSDMTETNVCRSSHGVRTASRICPVAASPITSCDCRLW